MQFQGKVDSEGVLRITNRKYFDEYLKEELCDKYVVIDINKKVKKRSNPQNAYYHGAVIPLVRARFKELGHKLSNEDVHLFLKTRFLKESITNEDGEYIGDIVKSTKKLTTTEFMEYIMEIQKFGAEVLDIEIPDPNEQTKLEIN